MIVNEIFGPTIQGEGKNAGMPCMFLRLANCNLACEWCDTKYSWDWSQYDYKLETKRMSVSEIRDILIQSPVKNLVITGGEPMLQQKEIRKLKSLLSDWWIEIETAGTIIPEIDVSQFNVSVKLSNSKNHLLKRYNPDAIDKLQSTGKATWKFVIFNNDDFDEIDKIVNKHKLLPVYAMPGGTDEKLLNERTLEMLPEIIKRNWYFTNRLHISLFGNKRKV